MASASGTHLPQTLHVYVLSAFSAANPLPAVSQTSHHLQILNRDLPANHSHNRFSPSPPLVNGGEGRGEVGLLKCCQKGGARNRPVPKQIVCQTLLWPASNPAALQGISPSQTLPVYVLSAFSAVNPLRAVSQTSHRPTILNRNQPANHSHNRFSPSPPLVNGGEGRGEVALLKYCQKGSTRNRPVPKQIVCRTLLWPASNTAALRGGSPSQTLPVYVLSAFFAVNPSRSTP